MSKFNVGDKVISDGTSNIHSDPNKSCHINGIGVILSTGTGGYFPILVDFDIGVMCYVSEDSIMLYPVEPKKYNDNKPMMSLIRPEFSKGLAKALTYGFTKYGEKRGELQNYLKGEGFHYSTIIDSLERHLNAFKSGVDIDEESGLDHLSLIAANLMFLHTYENSDKGIDDRICLEDLK